ncbi:hypothetical protein GC176_19945 [bacterium]|nr:hypothetical protein [bacterium]
MTEQNSARGPETQHSVHGQSAAHADAGTGSGCGKEITAYEIYKPADMPLLPAPIEREWMEQTQSRFAYRCLPLTIANQAGWVIPNPTSFTACWSGGPLPEDTKVSFGGGKPDLRISSLFGHGTITFNLPYLIRTPPDINLWVKGPTNQPKHGIQALEGIVETDWTAATFTMNWKLTCPNEPVHFNLQLNSIRRLILALLDNEPLLV